MRHRVAIVPLVCSAVPLGVARGQPAAQADSAAIVRAVWDAAVGGGSARAWPGRRAVWLWTPAVADSARVVPLSPDVRDRLVGSGLPASARRPAGDDTVVVRLTGWRTDSAGVLVELTSGWTANLGRCRAGSGNVEHYRVRRRGVDWAAERVEPYIHGDQVCRPFR